MRQRQHDLHTGSKHIWRAMSQRKPKLESEYHRNILPRQHQRHVRGDTIELINRITVELGERGVHIFPPSCATRRPKHIRKRILTRAAIQGPNCTVGMWFNPLPAAQPPTSWSRCEDSIYQLMVSTCFSSRDGQFNVAAVNLQTLPGISTNGSQVDSGYPSELCLSNPAFLICSAFWSRETCHRSGTLPGHISRLGFGPGRDVLIPELYRLYHCAADV